MDNEQTRTQNRYANVDWTKRDVDIARELGVTRACIGLARRRMKNGNVTSKQGRPANVAKKLAVWTKWKMRDTHIAQALGCSATAVAYYRALHDIPAGKGQIRYAPGKIPGRPRKSPWIKCADRLPLVGVHLLITGDRLARPEIGYLEEAGYWRTHGGKRQDHEISHWMPLPSPPEDESPKTSLKS